MATAEKNTATSAVTLPASPSSPSVKLVPFTVPITTKNRIGIFQMPKSSTLPGRNGIFMVSSTSGLRVKYSANTPVTKSCPSIFCAGESPMERFRTTLM